VVKIKELPKIERPREKHIGEGHRKRLRDRFLQSGLMGFLDYEIVELLLTLGTPRKDCKQMAKAAIKVFGGLRGVLDASLDNLRTIKGIGQSNGFGVKLFQAVSERYAKEKLPSKISLTTSRDVSNYLWEKIGREKKEHFVVLTVDNQNKLINMDTVAVGTLDANVIHPREIFEIAVRRHASSIIIAHNHPSGSIEPSKEDVEITKALVEAGKIMGIAVLDHLIIGDGYKSLL